MGARHRDCDGGLILEEEAGCKCRECCVCEGRCPSGDEGSGSGMAQRCRSVTGCAVVEESKVRRHRQVRANSGMGDECSSGWW